MYHYGGPILRASQNGELLGRLPGPTDGKKGGATRRFGAPILGALESPVGSRLAHRVDAVQYGLSVE